jgi:hypothetical protein
MELGQYSLPMYTYQGMHDLPIQTKGIHPVRNGCGSATPFAQEFGIRDNPLAEGPAMLFYLQSLCPQHHTRKIDFPMVGRNIGTDRIATLALIAQIYDSIYLRWLQAFYIPISSIYIGK